MPSLRTNAAATGRRAALAAAATDHEKLARRHNLEKVLFSLRHWTLHSIRSAPPAHRITMVRIFKLRPTIMRPFCHLNQQEFDSYMKNF